MSNDFYEVTYDLSPYTKVRSSQIDEELAAIESGFDALPDKLDLQQGAANWGSDSGTANAFVVTMNNPAVAYRDTMTVRFEANATNTGASTINIDTLGTVALKRSDGNALQSGDIVAGDIVEATRVSGVWRMTASNNVAIASATAASASADAAASSETQTGLDAVATAADRVQTGLDKVATAADRVQTGLDATATAADRVQTGLDATATAADRVQTGLDATSTAADRVQTGLDVTATGNDATATAADRVQTGLDATATAADRVQTGLDATSTAADRVQTGLDVTATGNDATATAADRVQTGLDVTAAALSETNSAASAITASAAAFAGNYQGEYSALTVYSLGQTASVDDDVFVSKSNGNVGNTPAGGDSDAYWFLVPSGAGVPLGASIASSGNLVATPEGFVAHTASINISALAYPSLVGILDTAVGITETLISDNAESGGNFGYSVSITDTYLAVGAYKEDGDSTSNSGRVYVFDATDGTLLQTIESPNAEETGYFGHSVSITDTYLAVGAYIEDGDSISNSGRVYVYTNTAGTYGSAQTLESPNAELNGLFGFSVSITDTYLAVGARGEDGDSTSDSGRVYVYTNTAGTYGSAQTLESPNAEASGRFGHSVSITDTYLAVGAYQEDGDSTSNSGRVYVYTNTAGTYGSVQTLESPNAEVNGYFGYSVSITDTYLAVGAYQEDGDSTSDSGRVYVYTNSAGTYGSVQTLESPNAEASGYFGYSVSITDTYLAVGAYNEDGDSTIDSGRVYVYTNTAGTYGSVQTLESPNAEVNGYFGYSVSITDTYLAVGAYNEDGDSTIGSGRVYILGYDDGFLIKPITGATETLTRVS